MNYKKEIIKGLSWLGAMRFVTRILSIIRIAILARILTPSDFGLFAIASVALSLTETFTETGINTILIQEKHKIDTFISTAWVVAIVRGILIGGVILLSTPFIISFFNTPSVLHLLLFISIVPVVKGFINPAVIAFQKDLDFHKEFALRTSVFLFDSIVTVVATIITRSPLGLAYGLIAGGIFEVVISFIIIKKRPRFELKREILRNILHKGKWVTFAGIFNYLFHNGDNIIIGKVLGESVLGLYDAVYRISMTPITEVGDVVSKTVFPIYVKISDDLVLLKKTYIRNIQMIGIVVIPLGIVGFLFAKTVVLILLGPQWTSAVPIFRVLIFFGVLRAILNAASPLFFAVKKQYYVTIITLVSFLVMITTIFPFIHVYGSVGPGYAVLTATIATIPFIVYFSYKVFRSLQS